MNYQERKEKIKQLRAKGFSLGNIGKIFGISRQRVHQILTNYQSNSFQKIRPYILKRDNWTCQRCGKKQKYPSLEVHHIDGNRHNNIETNLITLCPDCHRKCDFANSELQLHLKKIILYKKSL